MMKMTREKDMTVTKTLKMSMLDQEGSDPEDLGWTEIPWLYTHEILPLPNQNLHQNAFL